MTNLLLGNENHFRPGNAPESVLNAESATGNAHWQDGQVGLANVSPDLVRVSNISMPDDGVDHADQEGKERPGGEGDGRDVSCPPMCRDRE
jgi:hypothetical protein